VVSSKPEHWRGDGSWAADGNSSIDVGAVEFDGPGVTCPGGFERSYPWCPTELIDAGHVAANAPTLRFARTARRGFMLVTVTRETFATDYIFTPSVMQPTYKSECGGSFIATGGGNGPPLMMQRRECPPLPAALSSATASAGDGKPRVTVGLCTLNSVDP
jgi:hypothetical protein